MSSASQPMEAIDYVKAWMRVQDSVVGEGHYPESTACRRSPKSGRPKDSTARCWRCDAERLVQRSDVASLVPHVTGEDK